MNARQKKKHLAHALRRRKVMAMLSDMRGDPMKISVTVFDDKTGKPVTVEIPTLRELIFSPDKAREKAEAVRKIAPHAYLGPVDRFEPPVQKVDPNVTHVACPTGPDMIMIPAMPPISEPFRQEGPCLIIVDSLGTMSQMKEES